MTPNSMTPNSMTPNSMTPNTDIHRSQPGRRFGSDSEAMLYAIELAERGRGSVEPNPPVGAVIVNPQGEMIAEGHHQAFGQAHAEVNAIRAAGTGCRGNDLFVTLEPCSHHGKTPPCAPFVLEQGFRRIIIGCQDPAPHVAGQGIQLLRSRGQDVVVGVEESKAKRLIAPFEMLHCHHRPWVHAKWAMTADGRMATASGHSKWISSEDSRRLVHQLRGRMDAILTGAGTVRHDDPLLTARPSGPRKPFRVILDADAGCLNPQTQLVRSLADAPVLLFAAVGTHQHKLEALRQLGIESCCVPVSSASGALSIPHVLRELTKRKCTNLLLEAGPKVLGAFFDLRLIDEVSIFVAPKIVGGLGAMSPLAGQGLAAIPTASNLTSAVWSPSGPDILLRGDLTDKQLSISTDLF